ncbi:MAG: hypothetical protein ACLUSP_06660 [Christensenellales bacterium]
MERSFRLRSPYLSISLIGLFPYDPKRYDKVLADGKAPVKAHLRILSALRSTSSFAI